MTRFIELKERPLCGDFAYETGSTTETGGQGVTVGTDMGRFRVKGQQFLKEYEDHIDMRQVRRNEPLTVQD